MGYRTPTAQETVPVFINIQAVLPYDKIDIQALVRYGRIGKLKVAQHITYNLKLTKKI